MLTSELLKETITNKVANPVAWARKRAKLLRDIESQEKAAHGLIKAGGYSAERMIDGFVRHSGLDGQITSLDSMRLDRYYQTDRLAGALESFAQHGSTFRRYVASAVKDIEPLHETYREALALVPYIDAGMVEYGYEPGGDYSHDEDYPLVVSLARGYKSLAALVPLLDRVTGDIREKMALYAKRDEFAFDPHKYRPDHQDVETLYHASIHAADIAREGFSAERPDERLGVGNIGTQSLISFTSNLQVAHAIMRAFREIWMIAHGKLEARTIFGWMRNEGISITNAKVSANYNDPKQADPRIKTVGLYRYYQWMTKVRSNPVMSNMDRLMFALEQRAWTDIGILKCEVRLDDTVEFLDAEEEFRVNADRVVSVKRWI